MNIPSSVGYNLRRIIVGYTVDLDEVIIPTVSLEVLKWFDDILNIKNIEYISRGFLRMCMDGNNFNVDAIRWISGRIKWSSNCVGNIIEDYCRNIGSDRVRKIIWLIEEFKRPKHIVGRGYDNQHILYSIYFQRRGNNDTIKLILSYFKPEKKDVVKLFIMSLSAAKFDLIEYIHSIYKMNKSDLVVWPHPTRGPKYNDVVQRWIDQNIKN